MTAYVLDAGALIALDRDERDVWGMLRRAVNQGDRLRVPAGVIGQAWRDGRRQVLLARALAHCDEVSLDGAAARAAGTLCGRTGQSDVIDASVAVTAAGLAGVQDVAVVTSDPDDIRRLLSVLLAPVRVVEV
ncbi:MAG: twitching motility protein PilT [bacterium]|nr:twitching motility protein PilT [bacterium]